MRNTRHVLRVLALAGALGGTAMAIAPSTATASVAAAPRANSHWQWCNANAPSRAPKVLWTRIEQATTAHRYLPSSFWASSLYRTDIVRIVCYESTFDYRADGGGQYGWYQMSQSLISSEGITWRQYWDGNSSRPAGWYQCTAGERYILNRYGNPAVAWAHEANYGWY